MKQTFAKEHKLNVENYFGWQVCFQSMSEICNLSAQNVSELAAKWVEHIPISEISWILFPTKFGSNLKRFKSVILSRIQIFSAVRMDGKFPFLEIEINEKDQVEIRDSGIIFIYESLQHLFVPQNFMFIVIKLIDSPPIYDNKSGNVRSLKSTYKSLLCL